ncbi:MAG: hypothetical protein NT018_14285 [Armatimonadetes bacterium]|nr:hypothetical protein [Armatimonadota bacterium]
MKRPIVLALAITSIGVLLLSVFIFRRYLPYTGIDLGPKQLPAIVMEMNDVYLVGLGHEGKIWSAKAGSVVIGRSRSRTKITNLHDGKIFDKGKVALKVKAGSAIYDTFTRNLRLADGVEVLGVKGQKICAAGAYWNSAMQVLRSMGQVIYENGSSKIQADKLIVDLRNQQMDMWNITMSFTVGDIVDGVQEAKKNAR